MMFTSALLSLLLQAQAPMLVSADWLAQHEHDPNLVLLQVGPRDSYDTAHIAGARFMAGPDFSAPRDSTRPALELPTPARFDSILRARGISDASRIVIYSSDQWISFATRLYFTMYWAGLADRTSILDGGIEAWRARHGAVTAAAPTVTPGTRLTLHPRPDLVVTTDWVRAHLHDPHVALIDARDTPFYLGTWAGGTVRGPQGHIPGAYNIPFGSVVDSTGIMWPVPRLAPLFDAVRAEKTGTVVTYCHVGQQGTVIWFAAKLAGYDARLYDDSFTEWNKSAQNPIER